MISHEHRCIFIHIPKCAGTSIEAALGHLAHHQGLPSAEERLRGAQDHRSLRMLQRPVLTPDTLSSRENLVELVRRAGARLRTRSNPRNTLRVTPEQYASYFKFTIVRSPWSRAFSAYQNVVRDPVHRRQHGICGPISFSEYLRRFAGQRMITPQLHFIRDFSGAVPLDFIGRFENLTADFQEACRRMGIQTPPALPHELKGDSDGYRERYDAESIELVRRVYREEIEFFGYDFEAERRAERQELSRSIAT
jgi:Sulfotransferase family